MVFRKKPSHLKFPIGLTNSHWRKIKNVETSTVEAAHLMMVMMIMTMLMIVLYNILRCGGNCKDILSAASHINSQGNTCFWRVWQLRWFYRWCFQFFLLYCKASGWLISFVLLNFRENLKHLLSPLPNVFSLHYVSKLFVNWTWIRFFILWTQLIPFSWTWQTPIYRIIHSEPNHNKLYFLFISTRFARGQGNWDTCSKQQRKYPAYFMYIQWDIGHNFMGSCRVLSEITLYVVVPLV